MRPSTQDDIKVEKMNLQEGLLNKHHHWPVFWINTSRLNLRSGSAGDLAIAGAALRKAMDMAFDVSISRYALIKVHVGEPNNRTRMRPEIAAKIVPFLRKRGAAGVAAGDTTVAYTGPRGYKTNPPGDASSYLALAREHGWSTSGAAGIPFVVLDRPSTSVNGVFEFEREERLARVAGIERFRDFYRAGGFDAADTVVNYAHLTLHGLAGLAGCVKAVAMGCSALKGKFRMHQSLLPLFDEAACKACGLCVRNCPENALELVDDESIPIVDPQKCIGCGECEAICSQINRAVRLETGEISDWTRGQLTLPARMADYLIGLMNGMWEKTIHILEMVNVTERCDCLNMAQKPMLPHDAGFLVSRNPFAIDRAAASIHRNLFAAYGCDEQVDLLRAAEDCANYIGRRYGIICDSEPIRIDA